MPETSSLTQSGPTINASQRRREPADGGDLDLEAQQQKSVRALERKRAADRTARRLERSRTKEHIAQLEERVQLLLRCQDSGTASLIDRLLEENAALNQRVYDYQKQINSARLMLETTPVAPTAPASTRCLVSSTPHVYNQAPQELEIVPKCAPVPVVSQPQYTLPSAFPSGLNNACYSDSADHSRASCNPSLTSPIDASTYGGPYLPGPTSVYMMHHPSPLVQVSIYRTSAGLPDFHDRPFYAEIDPSGTQSLELINGQEKLDSFFGTILPIFNPSLVNLYQGVSDSLAGLTPQVVLDDLIPGFTRSCHIPTPTEVRHPDTITLLKLSLAKYTAGMIRDAQDPLSDELRRSSTERVAIFWIVTKLLTWMAFPTANNFAQIPPWYRPTQAQLSVPHPSYIDPLVFPLLREKLVYTHDKYKDTKLMQHLNSLFTIKWEPKMWWMCQRPEMPLISVSTKNPWDFELDPQFEHAIWDLRSWRMLPEFVALYPELASCVHT